MNDFEFYLEGDNTDSTASALEAFFKEAFDQQIRFEARQSQKTDQREKADPIAVTALVLAVPGAVLATLDLAERIKLKDKVTRLIKLAKEEKEKCGTQIFWLQGRRKGSKPLDQSTPAELLDAAKEEK